MRSRLRIAVMLLVSLAAVTSLILFFVGSVSPANADQGITPDIPDFRASIVPREISVACVVAAGGLLMLLKPRRSR